jgi:tetratricopeptide (TPR) repeat protein
MKKRHWSLLFLLASAFAQAQVLQDAETVQWLHQGIDKMYNYEFAAAEPVFEKVRQRYPQHPVYPMLKALETSLKYVPLGNNAAVINTYRNYLNDVVKKAEMLLDKNEKDAEGVFFAMSAHGFLALSYAEEDKTTAAVGEARKTYGYLKDGRKMVEQYADFYSPTGVYNYYVEQYPETHPIVKPFMIFFADGDKALGLKQLEIAGQRGIFTKTEALFFLIQIYIKHEQKPAKALTFSQQLIAKYPNNILYAMRHAEMLIANRRYDDALPYIGQVARHPDKVFQSTAAVFNGLIEEKQKKDHAKARSYYQKAVNMNALNKRYNNDYIAMTFAGLARIAAAEGKKEAAKNYYRKCLDIAEYEGTVAEAKKYLKEN